jgi:hypothetical protein
MISFMIWQGHSLEKIASDDDDRQKYHSKFGIYLFELGV